MGHNCDKSMLALSGMKGSLEHEGQKLLGNHGYASGMCVIPDAERPTAWTVQQSSLRSVVERVIGQVMMTFAVASGVFRGTPEKQVLALMCMYHIVQHRLGLSPLCRH
jgi:hypothetical protein